MTSIVQYTKYYTKYFPIIPGDLVVAVYLLLTIFDGEGGRQRGREGGCLVVADDRTVQGRAESSLTPDHGQ